MRNGRIRAAAIENNVMLWEVAERMGIADSTFYRQLRKEFTEAALEKVLAIIKQLAAEKKVGE